LKWIIGIVVVVGLAAGFGVSMVLPKFRPPPPKWKTEKVGHGDITLVVTSTGTVNPLQTVLVGAQISGRVKEVLKISNDSVKAGEVMAKLDTDLLESEKRSAQIRLSQTRAAVSMLAVEHDNLKLRADRLKNDEDRKRVTVERAKGTLELATKNLRRYKDLLKAEATSQTEVDIRELDEANSQRDMRLMQIDLEQCVVDRAQIEADTRQLVAKEEQAKADVDQAEAALEHATTNLAYCTILAPIDGVVLQHLIEPGQTIAASFQTPNLFKIASDLKHIRIDAALDEADIGRIMMKQDVTFDVDAYRSDVFIGKVAVVRLQSETKGNLVTYPVLVEAENPADSDHPFGKLLPGMTASLTFVVGRRNEVTLLPCAALRFIPPQGSIPTGAITTVTDHKDKKGTHGTVFVANALGVLQARSVRVGESDGDNFELLSGEVKEGEEVVVGTKM